MYKKHFNTDFCETEVKNALQQICYRAFILSRNLVRVKATDCKGNRHILSEPFPPNRLNTLLNLRFQGWKMASA